MADPFSRAWADPLRPFRVFAPIMAVASVGFLIATLVLAVSVLGADRVVVARGDAGSLTLPPNQANNRSMAIYGAAADGTRPVDEAECQMSVGSKATIENPLRFDGITIEGRKVFFVGEVVGEWSVLDVVTCSQTATVFAVTGSGPTVRLAIAGLTGVVAVGSGAFALIGFQLRRNRGQP